MPPTGAASMIGDAPLTKANDISGYADELLRQGDYSRAAQEHLKAAELYLESVQYTQDAKLQISLRRMHTEQLKLAEAAQRRVAHRERELQLQPNLAGPSSHHHRPRRMAPHRGTGGYQSQSDASPSMTPPLSQSPRSSAMRLQESIMSDASKTSGSESYMFLGPDYSEANDTFQKFWDKLEGLADQMTHGIAFTTIPLGDVRDIGDPPQHEAVGSEARTRGRTGHGTKSGILSRSKVIPKTEEFEADDDSSDSDSWDLVPSLSSPLRPKPSVTVTSASTTLTPATHVTSHNKQLQEENQRLQVEIEQMNAKVTKMENLMKLRAGQSVQLKESIMMAKREAQRSLMQSVTFRQPTSFTPMSPLLLDANGGGGGAPPPSTATVMAQQRSPSPFGVPTTFSPQIGAAPAASAPTANQQTRIRELEDENRSLKSEVAKLRSQNNRFRDKWATLKEGARRKRMLRDQAAAGGGDGGVAEDVRRQSIKEEEEED